MKATLKTLTFFLLIAPLVFNACKEDDIPIDLQLGGKDLRPLEIAMPIAKVNIVLEKWISNYLGDDAQIKYDKDSMISVEYRDTVHLGWDNLKKLVDITDKGWIYELTEEPIMPGKSLVPNNYLFNDSIPLSTQDDAVYDSLTYFTGYLKLALELPANMTGNIILTVPELKIDGKNPLTYSFDFSPGNRTFVRELNLGKGKINFNNNHINLNSQITVTNADPTAFPGNYILKFTLQDLDVENAWGYFGKIESNSEGNEFKFGFFDDLQIFREFEFGDINLGLKAENRIGVSFKIETDDVIMYMNKGDDFRGSLEMKDGKPIGMDVSAATVSKNGNGELIMNNTNSNIATMGSLFPNKLNYGLKGLSNFDNDNLRTNYIGVDTDLEVDLCLDFPLWFRAALYDRKDTVDFDVSSIFNDDAELAKSIDFVNLYLDVKNKFPFDVKIMAWVVDSANQYVDSLIHYQPFMVSSIPNENSAITNAKFEEFVISIKGNQLFDFVDKKVKKIVIQTASATYNQGQQLVKIFGQTGMEINLSMEAKVKIPDNIDKL